MAFSYQAAVDKYRKLILDAEEYIWANPELACVASAKWQLEMLSLLLSDNAKRAKEILDGFTPAFASKEEYFNCIDSFIRSGDRITYDESGASIDL